MMYMYVRDDIPQFRRSDIESVAINNQNGRIEILAIECKINNEKWLFISSYKQPKVKSDILNKVIDNIMMHYATDTYNVMILGDFNINLLSTKHVFIDCLEVNGLKNIVKEPTCTKGKPSLIDLIVTNKPKRFVNTVSVNTEMSDFHNLVCTYMYII